MIQPTHRADGHKLSRRDRRAPAFFAHIDEPASLDVTSNGTGGCGFRGWAASTRDRPVAVLARIGGGDPVEFAATTPRPDVVQTLGTSHGITDPACGFHFDVELPESSAASVPVAVEFADGELVAKTPAFRVHRAGKTGARATKESLARTHLRGEGVEFGALHQPLEVDPRRCVVRYADRLTKEHAVEKFPELRTHFDADVVEPDFIVDLDRGDLSDLDAPGFDFFIANDVIEHLANPVRFLQNVHDAMKPGALLFLSVPDRDYSFDVGRDLTPPEHLWEEHARGVTEVSTAHLRDFICHTDPGGLPLNPWRRRRLYRLHRERSIHVHVWNQESFDDFLARACERLGLRFETVDRAGSCDAGGSMVYVLRRS